MRIHRTCLSCVFTMTLCLPAITHAAATYLVGGGIARSIQGSGGVGLDEYFFTSTIGAPLSGGAFYNGEIDHPSTLGSSNSSASIFGLGASAYARAITDFNFLGPERYTFRSQSAAEGTWSDFIVSGPGGPSTIPISLNLFIEGSTSTVIGSSSSVSDLVESIAQLTVFGNGQVSGGSYLRTRDKSAGAIVSATGLLADFDGSTLVTTPVFNVPVNTPFSVKLQLSATAQVSAKFNEIFFMEAVTSFGNTLTFAPSGPAFNLPAGYTINSVDAGIVNNTYVVPEPSSMCLSALGVGVIFVFAFARRRSPRALLSQVAG